MISNTDVKTKGKKNYRIEGLNNMGHSECPFIQWFFSHCAVQCIDTLP